MATVRCTNIKWDTDGEGVDLPTSVDVEVEDPTDDDEVGDALSDKIGWCHKGFESEELAKGGEV